MASLARVAESSGTIVETAIALRHLGEIFLFLALQLQEVCGKSFRDKRQNKAALMLNIGVRQYLFPENVPRDDAGQLYLKRRAVQIALFRCMTRLAAVSRLCCSRQQLPEPSRDIPVKTKKRNNIVLLIHIYSLYVTVIIIFKSIS